MSQQEQLSAASLRQEFDASFAAAPAAAPDVVDVLAVRVAGDAYAVQVTEISGLVVSPALVRFPAMAREFLGVVGLRGSVVPVWSLAALLGHEPEREPPRWLLVVGSRGDGRDVALGFERFERQVQVPRDRLSLPPEGSPELAPTSLSVRRSVQLDDGWRGLLSPDAFVKDVERRLGPRLAVPQPSRSLGR